MSLQVKCACGRSYSLSREMAGKKVRCPACQGTISVPGATAAEDDEYRLADAPSPQTTPPRNSAPRVTSGATAVAQQASPTSSPASPTSRNYQKAVEAFGPLPAEVMALGEPLSVHPPSAAGRMLGIKLDGLRAWLADPAQERKRAFGMAIVLPVLSAGLLVLYLSGIQIGDAPRVLWLAFAGVGLLLGLLAGGYGWYLSRQAASGPASPPPPASGDAPLGFLFYASALVQARGGKFTVIRWQDVQTLEAPASGPYWRVTDRGGQQIELSFWVEDEATTIETTVERVKAVLLPQFVQRIEAGEKVMFGPFGVSNRCVYFKDKQADWIEVSSMRILTGRMYCLQIYCGGLLPWCTFHMLTAPNGELVSDLLTRVAPPRLLKPA